jgi:hypothetical protein
MRSTSCFFAFCSFASLLVIDNVAILHLKINSSEKIFLMVDLLHTLAVSMVEFDVLSIDIYREIFSILLYQS